MTQHVRRTPFPTRPAALGLLAALLIRIDDDQSRRRGGAHELPQLLPGLDVNVVKTFTAGPTDLFSKARVSVQNQERSENLAHKSAGIMWLRSARAVAG